MVRRAAKLAGLCMNSTASVGCGSMSKQRRLLETPAGMPFELLTTVERVVQARMHADPHGLVVDPHEALVANAGARAMTGGHAARFGADGDQRVDEDDEIGAFALRDVEVPDAAYAAVDVVPIADAHRAVEERQRRRSAARARHRDVVEPGRTEEHALGGVEIVGHDAQGVREAEETVGHPSTEEKLLEKSLERIEREEAGGERIVESIELLPQILGRGGARRQARHAAAKRAESGDDGAPPFVEIHAGEVPALERKVVVGGVEERAVEALHRKTTGERGGHGGAARRADVEIEAATQPAPRARPRARRARRFGTCPPVTPPPGRQRAILIRPIDLLHNMSYDRDLAARGLGAIARFAPPWHERCATRPMVAGHSEAVSASVKGGPRVRP